MKRRVRIPRVPKTVPKGKLTVAALMAKVKAGASKSTAKGPQKVKF